MKEAHKTDAKTRARRTRHARIRAKISGTAECPRIAVFRSNKQLSAQLIDDVNGKTLAAVNDEKVRAEEGDRVGKEAKAYTAGKEMAEKALALKIQTVVFDRGGYAYHGRVKAFAEGARDGGLTF